MRAASIAMWFAAILVCAGAHPAMARSLALIIGNDTYPAVGSLQKARNDARSYAGFFEIRGFAVTLGLDLDQRAVGRVLATFYDSIQPGDTVVFAFAGHGWSDGRENFILPTDTARTNSQAQLVLSSFPLKNGANGILDEISRRGPALSIVVIDACRNNPFIQGASKRAIGLARGLSPMEAPQGTFIAFSAGAGQTALDRLSNQDTNPNSLFTRNFLEQLAKPQELQAAFKATQVAVNDAALGIGEVQRPAYYDETIGRICLLGDCDDRPTPPAPPAPAPPELEADLKVAGITLRDLPANAPEKIAARIVSERGVLVLSVDQSSAAYAAGLRQADIIVAASSWVVDHPSEFKNAVDSKTEIHSDHLLLAVKRRADLILLTLPLGIPKPVPVAPQKAKLEPDLKVAGITLRDLPPDAAERVAAGVAPDQGAFVSVVDQTSDAYVSGLRAADVIIAASGRVIHRPSDFKLIADAMTKIPTSDLVLIVVRKGDIKLFNLPLVTSKPAPAAPPEPEIAPELAAALASLADPGASSSQHLLARLQVERFFNAGVGINSTNRVINGGIWAQSLTPDLAKPLSWQAYGAIITRARTGRPYENALQVGDVVTAMEDRPITWVDGFEVAVKQLKANEVHLLRVRRYGRAMVLFIKRQSDGSVIFPRQPVDVAAPAAKPAVAVVTVPMVGDLSRLNFTADAPRILTGFVSADARVADFTLSEVGLVQLALSGLSKDVDLVLATSNGTIFGKSNKSGTQPEQIDMKLQPGSYTVRLVSLDGQRSDYRLGIFWVPARRPPDFAQYGAQVGTYGDWQVYRNQSQRCWMVARAVKIQPEYGVIAEVPVFAIGVDPGDSAIFILLYDDPGEVNRNSMKITVRDAAGITATLPAVFEGDWLKPLSTIDGKIVIDTADMKRIQQSDTLVVSGLGSNGDPFSFEYSLIGYTKAARAINVLCDANAYWVLGQ